MVNKVSEEMNKFSMTTEVVAFEMLFNKFHFVLFSEIERQ